jgi:hypothetical protein
MAELAGKRMSDRLIRLADEQEQPFPKLFAIGAAEAPVGRPVLRE